MVADAESVVELHVEGVEAFVDETVFGDWFEDGGFEAGHSGLGVGEVVIAAGFAACDDGARNCGAECASLGGARDFHFAAEDVGVDLHEEGVLFCDAAAVYDFVDFDAVLFKPVDDGKGAEGGGFDEGAVNFFGACVEGLTEEEACEALVDEDCAVAVIPVECEEAGAAGVELCGLFGEGVVGAVCLAAGGDAVYEPVEDVTDGGLASFEAEIAG